MELGFFTMPLHPPGTDYTQGLDADLEQIVTLDGLGFREAWIGEHFTSVWENIPAPDLLIASAIHQTENIVRDTGDGRQTRLASDEYQSRADAGSPNPLGGC